MTEAEWLTYTEPEPMRQLICNKTSERKRLLYMVAWSLSSKTLTWDQRSRLAVEVAEQYADGLATDEDFSNAGSSAFLVKLIPILMGCHFKASHAGYAHLLRDIVGNPFRNQPSTDPTWLRWNDGTVVKIAQSIYEDRAFDRLPILADALEDAGCTNSELLAHCRVRGPHARGCWVVDLLLEKE